MDEMPVERLLRRAHREATEAIQLLRSALREAPSSELPELMADAVDALVRIERIEVLADLALATGPGDRAHENARAACSLARELRDEIARRYRAAPIDRDERAWS